MDTFMDVLVGLCFLIGVSLSLGLTVFGFWGLPEELSRGFGTKRTPRSMVAACTTAAFIMAVWGAYVSWMGAMVWTLHVDDFEMSLLPPTYIGAATFAVIAVLIFVIRAAGIANRIRRQRELSEVVVAYCRAKWENDLVRDEQVILVEQVKEARKHEQSDALDQLWWYFSEIGHVIEEHFNGKTTTRTYGISLSDLETYPARTREWWGRW